jgi:hypothetical protein
MKKKLYIGKSIGAFLVVLLLMPLGHAMMALMEHFLAPEVLHYCAFAMGFVGLVVAIWGVFAKGDTHQTILGIVGAMLFWTGWVEFLFVYYAQRFGVHCDLYGSGVILPYIENLKLENLVIASPDVGGAKRAKSFAKYLDCPLVLCNNTRARANVIESMQIIGDVKGKDVVIVDDMVDTAGTITKAANIMMEAGARTVRACASHCVMSGPASERVQESALEEIVFTDSIPYANRCAKVKQLSVADMFAETIRRVINNESISNQYLI